jgi:PhzF family phenazine biosynthesis protein
MCFQNILNTYKLQSSIEEYMHIWQVNAFTNEPFKGNPAGVCIVSEFPSDDLAQKIAAEVNYSETTYLKKITTNHYHIRWFSPKDECGLCGHATLAAAHLLWEQGHVKDDIITFDSMGGPLTAQRNGSWITLNFPSFVIEPAPMPELLNKALGFVPVTSVYKDDIMYVVVLPSVQAVRDLKPNFAKIAQLPCRSVTVTALNEGEIDSDIDFVSRYFAPKVGIPEDPVCGSAHCRLTPLWAEKLNKTSMNALQVSDRTGFIKVTLENNRVTLTAQAITVMEGNLLAAA